MLRIPWVLPGPKRRARYSHVTLDERARILQLRAAGAGITEIARAIGRSRAAVYRAFDAEADRRAAASIVERREFEDALVRLAVTDPERARALLGAVRRHWG